jgi:DNA-binding PucR family transcriptional regulator
VARERRGLAGEHLGRATLLIPSSDDDETARAVHRQLRRAAGRAVTVIAERVSGQEWSRAFGLASRCCALVQALGTVDVGATTSRYALYALLFDADRGADLDRFVTDAIGPLLDYDRQRATALVPTLTAYYAHGANLARTARALHIHLNTLLKRLDRATAVLGCDWRNDGDLQRPLALRLHELRGRLG